jgi:transcriptional regulator with XRE-family HTH domain
MEEDTGEMAFRKMVGRRLQEARKSAGLNLDTVADHFDVSRAAVGHWETGKNPMDLGRLYLLARLYRTSVFALVAEDLTTDDFLALTRRQLEAKAPAGVASVGVDKLGARYVKFAPAPSSPAPANQPAEKAPHAGKPPGGKSPKRDAPAGPQR